MSLPVPPLVFRSRYKVDPIRRKNSTKNKLLCVHINKQKVRQEVSQITKYLTAPVQTLKTKMKFVSHESIRLYLDLSNKFKQAGAC